MMRARRAIAATTTAGAVLAVLFFVLPGAATATTPATSARFAGYAYDANEGNLQSIGANWVIPKVICGYDATNGASMYVAIDGFKESDIIASGTFEGCSSGTAFYGGFYRFSPTTGIHAYALLLRPGDSISTDVSCYYYASTQFMCSASIYDNSVGASQYTNGYVVTATTNAGIVVVSHWGNSGTLADFGKVRFTDANLYTTNGQGYDFGSLGHTSKLTLADSSGYALATPGPLNETGYGDNFAVMWIAST